MIIKFLIFANDGFFFKFILPLIFDIGRKHFIYYLIFEANKLQLQNTKIISLVIIPSSHLFQTINV